MTSGSRLAAANVLSDPLLARLPVGVVVYDRSGRTMHANRTAQRMLGQSEAQLMGLVPADLRWAVEREDGSPLRGDEHPASVALRTGEAVRDVVVGVRSPDDDVTWHMVSAEPLIDLSVDGAAVVVTFSDITAEVRLRRLLEKSEQLYRLLADNSTDIVVRAEESMVTWVSPSVSALGWAPDDWVGRSPWEFVHPDDLAQEQIDFRSMLEGRELTHRLRLMASDGTYHWVESHARAFVDERGDRAGIIASMHGVDREVAAEEALRHSRERYRLLAENASDLVFVTGPDRRFDWVSPTVTATLGWAPAELVGRQLTDLIRSERASELEADRAAFYAGVDPSPGEGYVLEFRTKSGNFRWLSGRQRPRLDETGRPSGVVAGFRDVTDLVRANQRLEAVLASMLDPQILVSASYAADGSISDLSFVDVNAAACARLRAERGELIGASVLATFTGPAGEHVRRWCGHVLATGEAVVIDDQQMLSTLAGRLRWFDVRAVRAGDEVSITWRDVTDRHEAQERLARAASQDSLTGLLSRGEVIDRLGDLLSQGPGAGRATGVAFCDLDDFKDINDAYGHAVGDAALRVLAGRIASAVRDTDMVARIGGDEILVVLDGVHDLAEANVVARKILTCAREAIALPDLELTVTVSVGVALAKAAEPVDSLIARADQAMYEAKKGGKDRIVAIGPPD